MIWLFVGALVAGAFAATLAEALFPYGSSHTTVTPLRRVHVCAPVENDYEGSVAQAVVRHAGRVRQTVTVALKSVVAGIRRHRSLTEAWPMDVFSGVGRHREGVPVALTLARL